MKSDTIEIKAKLTLYPTENGGRETGIKTGYRPNHVFYYKKDSSELLDTYIGQIDFEKEWVLPGETVEVIVRFLKDGNIEELLTNGRIWWIHEGARAIGKAQIKERLKN
jgi:translation elongation factor EF-Tu-like GTPase